MPVRAHADVHTYAALVPKLRNSARQAPIQGLAGGIGNGAISAMRMATPVTRSTISPSSSLRVT
jgi:hypothetical protein